MTEIELLPGDPPQRKRSHIQAVERELATRLREDLTSRSAGEPSSWARHPVEFAPDTARVVTSRINTGRRQELPGDEFESTCIDGVVYVRARAGS